MQLLRNIVFFVILLFIGLPVAVATCSNNVISSNHADIIACSSNLTEKDWNWLANKQEINIGILAEERPPFTVYSNQGNYEGVDADFIALLQRYLKTPINIKKYDNYQQAFDDLKSGEIDSLLSDSIVNTAEIAASESMLKSYPVLVTQDTNMMRPLRSDKPVSIATVSGYVDDSEIKKYFPNAKITHYPNYEAGLYSVQDNQNDYFIGDGMTTGFITERSYGQLLTIINILELPPTNSVFLTQSKNDTLLFIINNFIKSITREQRDALIRRWIRRPIYTYLPEKIVLTPKEQRWITEHPNLRVVINPYSVPFTLIRQQSEIRGISGDILRMIELRTGLSFTPVIANSNTDLAHRIHSGDWDLLAAVTYSQEREKEMSFSHNIVSTNFVVIVKNDANAPKSLNGKLKIAIPQYSTLQDTLSKKHPNIEWVIVKSTVAALHMIQDGEVDGAIYNQISASYMIDHYYRGILKIGFQLEHLPASIAFAAPRGEPELQSILNKVLDDIQPSDISYIINKWLYSSDIKIDTWRLYNKPFYVVAILATLLVLSSLLWGIYLLRQVRMRRASQAELLNQVNFRDALLNGAPMPIYVINTHGEILSHNQAYDSFFFSGQPEHLATSLYDMRHPLSSLYIELQKNILSNLQPGQVSMGIFELNNGIEQRIVSHWVTPFASPNQTLDRVICGWQDITDSRNLLEQLSIEKERAIQSNKAKSTFLATMSHEIRTPISAIIGFLELVTKNEQKPEDDKEAILTAYSTAQSLLGVIGDILDIAKIESGHFELAPEWVDIDQYIGSVVQMFEGLAQQKGLRLIYTNQLDKPVDGWLDPQCLKQVLANFLGNAIKFTHVGQVELILSGQFTTNEQLMLRIQITDTGVGISEEEQQQLFTPFKQSSSGKGQTGTGLGLVISQELLQQMGGRVALESRRDQGTAITLELGINSRPISEKSQQIIVGNTPAITALKVLIVDDHIVNLLLLRRQLTLLGYQVDEATNGQQALNLWRNNHYDVIITDCNMPIMDGLTLTRQIRAINRPVVIWGLTANAQPQERETCLAAGMDKCFFKPVSLQQLSSALYQVGSRLVPTRLASLIDLPALQKLSHHDPILVRKMLEHVQLENDKDVEVARQALKQQNWSVFSACLHRFRGVAQIIGAEHIETLCTDVEAKCRLEDSEKQAQLKDSFQALEETLTQLSTSIREYLQS